MDTIFISAIVCISLVALVGIGAMVYRKDN
ncbi:hypothetical protein TKV_c17690 [Thermoanaerobacter kivui]|uniref:Uncharacterized protein n=1 Tax=Thermoanaerobacter kivui TaxID=2325 RepID=A0A097ASV9_THEKI|nr:hypothetical protein TKV_c17690 [Thermoanaerobacter kivui]